MLPRISLILAPTPLHRLDRLSAELGIDLWIKRDDLTGFALGGNKGRKLEYLVADALDQGADTMVSCGSIQSNFIRQLGAACAVQGMRCVAAVMESPFDSQAGQPTTPTIGPAGGNVTLCQILGVELRVFPDDDWEVLYDRTEALALELEQEGARVCRVPVGGSSPLGAYAFYQAGQELQAQSSEPFDWIVFASSSGSTHTGLAYAFRGTSTRILGIACDPEPEIATDFAGIGEGLAALIGTPDVLTPEDFRLDFGSVGEGYGVPSIDGQAAISRLARRQGIFLDPVYTGKAFAGLLRLAEERVLTGRVLFWHTGGTPALFAY